MWGVIPAAGKGSIIQPPAFSQELLPVGSRTDGTVERPRVVSEHLVERMIRAGATKLCFVIAPGKSDIMEYYGSSVGTADVFYVVQSRPAGLCDAIFRTCPLINPDERIVVGLPDTIWFPENGMCDLDGDVLSFLLFPVRHPELFEAVSTDAAGNVTAIHVKDPQAPTRWIWGAFGMTGRVLHVLHDLWREPRRGDEFLGTLINAYLKRGGRAVARRTGETYVDVGTLDGYREAIQLLDSRGDRRERPDTRQEKVPTAGAETNQKPALTREVIERKIRELGEWFHNMNLSGVQTAPDHFLGDYPRVKWERFADALPSDLHGMTVLDIGCNAGFYSIEVRRRGADRVVGIDSDDEYLAQARFAAEVSGFPDIEFRKLSVYDLAELGERFDLVFFMGVLYHLRHPLLALDLIHEHATRDLLVFQSMQRGNDTVEVLEVDYGFWQTEPFDLPGYPRLHFVEHSYSGDITNWWIPNRACAEAMLRSAGYRIEAHPEDEVYICRHLDTVPDIAGPRAAYPARKDVPQR